MKITCYIRRGESEMMVGAHFAAARSRPAFACESPNYSDREMAAIQLGLSSQLGLDCSVFHSC
jgi:hypothetical protein